MRMGEGDLNQLLLPTRLKKKKSKHCEKKKSGQGKFHTLPSQRISEFNEFKINISVLTYKEEQRYENFFETVKNLEVRYRCCNICVIEYLEEKERKDAKVI